MCDVVDVSWLTAGMEVELELTWGTASGVLTDVPTMENALYLGPVLVRKLSPKPEPSLDLVRVVSPAPPVTPAAEEWAVGDLATVTYRDADGEEFTIRAMRHGKLDPFWLLADGDDCDDDQVIQAIPLAVCPPGLTPVDLDELAGEIARLIPGREITTLRGMRAQVADFVASYQRSGSAER